MFCSNCGAQVGENEKFCKVCGTPVAVQQPVPQPAPVVYQQPVPQPVPPVYQQPVQSAPQAAPAVAKEKGGPRRTCFVVGLITCILLILEVFPVLFIGAMFFLVGPFAMMLGATNSEDLLLYGLLIFLAGVILMALAVVSIVFNGISTKITKKRPASKCRSLRTAAAIMTAVDAAIVVAPIFGLNNIMEDAEFFYIIFGITFVMAIVFLVLSLITNAKEKKLASA